jgi:hypothetical protein
MAEYFRMTGNAAHAVESGERALTLATALGDSTLQVMATFYVGTAYQALGTYRRAVDCFRRNVAALTGERSRERFGMTGLPAVMSRTWLVSCLADLGAFDEGTARGEVLGRPWGVRRRRRTRQALDHARRVADPGCRRPCQEAGEAGDHGVHTHTGRART